MILWLVLSEIKIVRQELIARASLPISRSHSGAVDGVMRKHCSSNSVVVHWQYVKAKSLKLKKTWKMWNFGLKRIDKHRTHSLADSHWYLAQATKLRNCKAKTPTEPMTSSALTRQDRFQLSPMEWHCCSKVFATQMDFQWCSWSVQTGFCYR